MFIILTLLDDGTTVRVNHKHIVMVIPNLYSEEDEDDLLEDGSLIYMTPDRTIKVKESDTEVLDQIYKVRRNRYD